MIVISWRKSRWSCRRRDDEAVWKCGRPGQSGAGGRRINWCNFDPFFLSSSSSGRSVIRRRVVVGSDISHSFDHSSPSPHHNDLSTRIIIIIIMTSTAATQQQQPSMTPQKHRKEFLAPLRSLVRSLSGNNLAAKNKKHEKATAMPAPTRPPPEKLVKGRRRASSFWSKKVRPTGCRDNRQMLRDHPCAADSTILRRQPGSPLLFSRPARLDSSFVVCEFPAAAACGPTRVLTICLAYCGLPRCHPLRQPRSGYDLSPIFA